MLFSRSLSCVLVLPSRGARHGGLRPYRSKAAPTKKILRCATASIDRSEQSMQDSFLHVHAVFGLIENDRLWAVEDFRSNFQAAVRRKTAHERGVRRGERHHLGVDLIRLERGLAHLPLVFKSHAGPRIGVNGLRAAYRLAP